MFQLHPTNRGVGLWQDKLYLATTDDHVVALEAKTGKVIWDTKVQWLCTQHNPIVAIAFWSWTSSP